MRIWLFCFLVGCGGGSNTGDEDAAVVVVANDLGPACTPLAKECINDVLARICPSDGSGWLSQACALGEKCDAGLCKGNLDAVCTPGDGACLSTALGLRCRTSGMGYEMVSCAPGTVCVGAGLCQGTCIVGAQSCPSPAVIGTCSDGKKVDSATCPAGELCVTTGTTPFATASCKPAECQPASDGCDLSCGNKTDASADQQKFMSLCQETPLGYKWLPIQCPAPTTCNPLGGPSCAGGGQAGCTSECVPGQMRCSPDLSGSQTCGSDGKWPVTVTPCAANAAGEAQLCLISRQNAQQTICGEPVCALGEATCEADGKIRRCGNDGKLLATAVSCTSGRCVAEATPVPGKYLAGHCVEDCVNGDQICFPQSGAGTYSVCQNGVYSTPISCGDAGSVACLQYTAQNGRPRTLCGADCAPGTHRCEAGDAGANTAIATCGSDGKFAAAVPCPVGRCTPNPGNTSDAFCLTECVPGQTVCLGATAAVEGTPFSGFAQSGVCSGAGLFPDVPANCPANQLCRRGASGHATGCVECVGTPAVGGNEAGLIDTRCSNAVGAAGSTHLGVCTANNTWGTPTACNNACVQANNAKPGGVCGSCGPNLACTESSLKNSIGFGCQIAIGDAPVMCGATPDCCESFCQTPTPASCQ